MPAKFVSCPLCGQGFGSASIGIHVPQCYDKALKRWQLDPRGPKPVMPSRGLSTGTVKSAPGSSSMPSYNNGATVQPLRSTLNQRQQQLRLPEEAYADVNPNLHPCRKCKRTFAFDRIAYHESVCKGNKPRKQFNSKKQRLSNFDEFEIRAAAGGGGGGGRTVRGGVRGGHGPMVDTRQSGATSWRRQHADFIAAIRSAKQHERQVSALQSRVQQQPQRGDLGGGRRQPRQPFAANALRQPETYRMTANRAAAGAALGPRQSPQFPQQAATSRTVRTTPAGSGRGAVNAARSSGGSGYALGGPSNAGAYGGGAPSYRIQNTNQTSSAMLQAMGRY